MPAQTTWHAQQDCTWLHYIAPIIIVGAALALRLYQLDATSLWSDEGNTWALIQRTWSRIATDAAADIHPPGYYWLLKLWSTVAGVSAVGMRSFSAVAGALLVFAIYRIGRRLWATRVVALLAATIAAVSPFQVYYSQEARMYILLALEAAGLYWALIAYMDCEEQHETPVAPACWLWVTGAAGLWTHYSFPIVLASAGIAYLVHLRLLSSQNRHGYPRHDAAQDATERVSTGMLLLRFAAINFAILLFFVPWLPIAINRVVTWPQGGVLPPAVDAIQLIVSTMVFGPFDSMTVTPTLWLWVGGLAPLVGILAIREDRTRAVLASWLVGPIVLMFALGLFGDAFLKFLLVASPAWSLAAAAPLSRFGQWSHDNTAESKQVKQNAWIKYIQAILSRVALQPDGALAVLLAAPISLALLAPAWFLLPSYYSKPTARDNYAGIARYIGAVGDAATDLVVLNAPGQQDVWSYYDPGLPVAALPIQRPPDVVATTATLEQATASRSHVYALFWAQDEADPDHIVERWLDQNAFKGLDTWQGNVRFVEYTLPNQLACHMLVPQPAFGELLRLDELCLGIADGAVTAGEVAALGLRWRALEAIDSNYKISIQLLDTRNQVVAQHDAEPAGGSRPTTTWQTGELINDNHGLAIPFGTPPSAYQMIVAVYAADTGVRLSSATADFYPLGELTVQRPRTALPLDILSIDNRLDIQLGSVRLAGYNAHRQGYAHAPETPIAPGHLVHFTFFWVAPDPMPASWGDDIQFTLQLGDSNLTAPLAGSNYPTGKWQPGELVRGEFDIAMPKTESKPRISIGESSTRLHALPIAP